MKLYEVTGPLKLASQPKAVGDVFLKRGEVVELQAVDEEGDALVAGVSTGKTQYIDFASLTPLDEDEEAPDFDYSAIRDFVWEGEE